MGRTAEMLQARRPACYRMDNAFAEKKQMVLTDGFMVRRHAGLVCSISIFSFSLEIIAKSKRF